MCVSFIDGNPVFPFPTAFEYDPDKEVQNRGHGYSLESCADWLRRLTFPLGPGPAPTMLLKEVEVGEEKRYVVLTVDWEGNIVQFVFTLRCTSGNTVVRIISYRRASPEERNTFNSEVEPWELQAWLTAILTHPIPNL